MGNAGTQLTVVCMHPALVDWVTAGIEDGQHWYSAHSCVHACSPGWLVHWGEKMANTSAQVLTDSFSEILAYNQGSGCVNFYMAHGGTKFGWTAGKTQLWTSKCTFKSW